MKGNGTEGLRPGTGQIKVPGAGAPGGIHAPAGAEVPHPPAPAGRKPQGEQKPRGKHTATLTLAGARPVEKHAGPDHAQIQKTAAVAESFAKISESAHAWTEHAAHAAKHAHEKAEQALAGTRKVKALLEEARDDLAAKLESAGGGSETWKARLGQAEKWLQDAESLERDLHAAEQKAAQALHRAEQVLPRLEAAGVVISAWATKATWDEAVVTMHDDHKDVGQKTAKMVAFEGSAASTVGFGANLAGRLGASGALVQTGAKWAGPLGMALGGTAAMIDGVHDIAAAEHPIGKETEAHQNFRKLKAWAKTTGGAMMVGGAAVTITVAGSGAGAVLMIGGALLTAGVGVLEAFEQPAQAHGAPAKQGGH